MKYKSFAATIEQKDGGTVRAYASTFDREPDSYGDIVAPNAFDNTIKRWKSLGKPIPILWGHDTSDPFSNIGAATDFGVDERGFWYEADFDPDNEKAQYIRKLLKEGRVFQCSFAYQVNDAGPIELEDGTTAYELRDIDIFEISIVQIPANQHATVEDVKSVDLTPLQRTIAEMPETFTAEDFAKSIEDATGLLVREFAYSAGQDSVPEITIKALAPDGIKSGRRNSKKDADELRSIADHASAIQSIVNGLLADEQEEEPKGGEPEAKAEEPGAANAEEPTLDAKALGLLQQAEEILEKGN